MFPIVYTVNNVEVADTRVMGFVSSCDGAIVTISAVEVLRTPVNGSNWLHFSSP
jgi:hypothetical protein